MSQSFSVTARAAIRFIISLPCRLFLVARQKVRNGFSSARKAEERTIVSMTSWPPRIGNVPLVVKSILHNSIKPDLIVLNLSESEFPNREEDLPSSLMELIDEGAVQVMWQPKNTKAFKKIIPTLVAFPTDVIIAVDDDFIYPIDFIETFMNKHKECPLVPLSGNTVKIGGAQAHCGCASLVKREFFGPYLEDLMDERVIEIGMDDIFYTYCVALNGLHYQYVGKSFFYNMVTVNPKEALTGSGRYNNDDMRAYLSGKIRKQYHINMTLISKPFFVI